MSNSPHLCFIPQTAMAIRDATFAGSWYSGSRVSLNNQMDAFLTAARTKTAPISGARFVVGPHAGYSYAGSTLAETYNALDLKGIKRLFILGPSHNVAFRGGMVSNYQAYRTPLGDVPVDREVSDKLISTGLFSAMSPAVDKTEHCFEMHVPFIYKVCSESDGGFIRPIIPIMIAHTDARTDLELAKALQPYFENPENAFAVSTDFCHWGRRFDYTAFTDAPDAHIVTSLRSSSRAPLKVPIYKGIEYLDRQAMKAASTGSYRTWSEYLDRTEITVCGRTPLGIMILVMELIANPKYGKLEWIGYKQSSRVVDLFDSSVSYSSGYAVC